MPSVIPPPRSCCFAPPAPPAPPAPARQVRHDARRSQNAAAPSISASTASAWPAPISSASSPPGSRCAGARAPGLDHRQAVRSRRTARSAGSCPAPPACSPPLRSATYGGFDTMTSNRSPAAPARTAILPELHAPPSPSRRVRARHLQRVGDTSVATTRSKPPSAPGSARWRPSPCRCPDRTRPPAAPPPSPARRRPAPPSPAAGSAPAGPPPARAAGTPPCPGCTAAARAAAAAARRPEPLQLLRPTGRSC
jgi:hypothetical protein